jgi:hypothetical protein
MKVFLAISLLLIGSILSSCKQNSATEIAANAPGVILPLAVGNQWVMDNTGFDSLGTKTVYPIDTITVAHDTLLNGEHWYTIKGDESHIYANKPDGWYSLNTLTHQTFMVMKYPAASGDSFFHYFDALKVLTTDTLITIPSGQYKCYCYYRGGYLNEYYDFYCPNIGEIKFESHQITAGGRKYVSLISNLITYRVKQTQ